MLATATGSTRESANDKDSDNNKLYFRTQERADQVAVMGIRATILAEASSRMFMRKNKLAGFVAYP